MEIKFIIKIVAGTNCQLTDFVPNQYSMSHSERISLYSEKPIYEPFYKTLFIDSLVPADYLHGLENSLFNQLKCRKSEETTFYYGRPLWASLLQTKKFSRQSILEFAQCKIIFNDSWKHIKDKYEQFLASLALMSVSTTLSVSYQATYGSELILKYMSTLFYINPDRTSSAFRYFSEPILAEGNLVFICILS